MSETPEPRPQPASKPTKRARRSSSRPFQWTDETEKMILWAALQYSAKSVPKYIWHNAAYVIGNGVTNEGCRQHFYKLRREMQDKWTMATRGGLSMCVTPPPEIEIGKVDKKNWNSDGEVVMEPRKTGKTTFGFPIVLETGKRLVDEDGDIIGNTVRDGDGFQGVVDVDNADAEVVLRVVKTWRANYAEDETMVQEPDPDDAVLNKSSAAKSAKPSKSSRVQKNRKTPLRKRKQRA